MPRILVVDDQQADRDVACTILRQDPSFDIETAENGEEALSRLEKSVPDLVLTDLVMPEMDGLELVGGLHEKFPDVPAIVMTSQGSERIAAAALKAGAASYVPKAEIAYDLLENVKRVLAVSYRKREESRLMKRMVESESVFSLENDSDLVPTLVKHLQGTASLMGLCGAGEHVQMGVALSEALNNAMHHGNLEVDSRLREDDHTAYEETIEKRAKEPPYRDRRVHVAASFSRDRVRFVVRDEGKGFDVSRLPDPRDPANVEKVSGRGVFLMRAFMDDVRYNETGNEVTMVLRRRG